MRLLFDENMPGQVAALLSARGYEIERVELSASDHDILAASSDSPTLLFTYDKDFGELIYREHREQPAGVLLIRDPSLKPRPLADLIHRLLSEGHVKLEGYFSVLNP